jgi:hypothetical protein
VCTQYRLLIVVVQITDRAELLLVSSGHHRICFAFFISETYDFVKTEVIGQSYEGRETRTISICRAECGDKPGMYIEGGE